MKPYSIPKKVSKPVKVAFYSKNFFSDLKLHKLHKQIHIKEKLTKKELSKIREDLVKIIKDSKATFFDDYSGELFYQLRAEICTNVERYFNEKL